MRFYPDLKQQLLFLVKVVDEKKLELIRFATKLFDNAFRSEVLVKHDLEPGLAEIPLHLSSRFCLIEYSGCDIPIVTRGKAAKEPKEAVTASLYIAALQALSPKC